MQFGRTHVSAVRGRDEDRATGVSSLANEEPLIDMDLGIDIMREVIGKDCSDGSDCMIGEGETSLCCSRHRFGGEGSSGTENGDVSCDWGVSSYWGLEVLLARGGDIDIVRVDGDIIVKWGEEEGVEDFLSNLGGSGRHHWLMREDD